MVRSLNHHIRFFLTKTQKITIAAIGIVLVIVIGSVLATIPFTKQKAKGNLQNSTGVTSPVFGEFQTFTSQDLGISFVYASGPQDQRVLIKEIGTRVYLYVAYLHMTDKPEDGKFIEVFSKDPNQSLIEAVRNRFLQGYNPSTCPVIPARLRNGTANTAREYVQITTMPHANTNSGPKEMAFINQCPKTYTTSSLTGNSYFMMDPKHPDKYVYFVLGSDDFLAAPWTGKGLPYTWDESLTFLGN